MISLMVKNEFIDVKELGMQSCDICVDSDEDIWSTLLRTSDRVVAEHHRDARRSSK